MTVEKEELRGPWGRKEHLPTSHTNTAPPAPLKWNLSRGSRVSPGRLEPDCRWKRVGERERVQSEALHDIPTSEG